MKKLLSLLISMLILGVVSYFLIIKVIDLYNKKILGDNDIIILSVAFFMTLVIGIFIVIYAYRKKDKKIKWLNNRLEQWSNLSVHVNKAGDEVFSELPIGIIIYDEQFEIKWVNRYAKKIYEKNLLEHTLGEIQKDLYLEIANKKENFTIQIKDKSYDIIHKPLNRLIYFFEVSEREKIKLKYQDRTPTIGIISLDNFDSETKAFDIQEKASIRGQYLGEISDWAEKYASYIQAYDDDSLFLILDQASLRKMIEEKFDILDKIREISTNTGIRVTASIGMACWDISYEELGTYAQNAIDLAEKRGGDQAVINIQNEKVQYFGALSNAIEKNNLLAARAKTLALKDVIEASSNIFIMTHINADADALGAMIGTLRLSLMSNKPSKIVLDTQKVDATVEKLLEDIMKNESDLKNYITSFENASDINADSLLIIVDTQSPKIIMDSAFLDRFKKLAVIDHHRSGEVTFNEPIYAYQESYASSSVELISEMFAFFNTKEKVKLTPFEATIMLTGIVVDTNNFTFRCGTRTFEAASILKEYGADMVEVRKILRNDFGAQMNLTRCVASAELILENFAIVKIPEEDIITDRTFLSKISDYLLNIDGVEAAFAIARYDNGTDVCVSISARSYQGVNVQIIMEEMGGGGHLNASATQIYNASVEDAYQQLLNILKRDYETGDEVVKVILLEDIKGRGIKNQVIEVATGYGNFLISSKKGKLATEENLTLLKEENEKLLLEEQNQRKILLKIKEDIEERSVNIYIKIGVDGKAFGQITSKQICEEFEAQTGIHLDKRKLQMPTEINSVGVYMIPINLSKDISANLEVNVLEK